MAKETKDDASKTPAVVTPQSSDREIDAIRKRLREGNGGVLEVETAKQMARETGLTIRGNMTRPGEDRAIRTTVMPVFECTAKEVRAMAAGRPEEPESKVLLKAVRSMSDSQTVAIAKETAMKLLGELQLPSKS